MLVLYLGVPIDLARIPDGLNVIYLSWYENAEFLVFVIGPDFSNEGRQKSDDFDYLSSYSPLSIFYNLIEQISAVIKRRITECRNCSYLRLIEWVFVVKKDFELE